MIKKDDRLLFMLSKAQHTLSAYLKKKFKEEGVHVSPGQMGILFLLVQKDLRPMNELSKILDIDNSAITRLVDRLEKAGLAQRTMNSADRRQYLIGITEKGREQSAKAKNISKQANDKIKDGFTDSEVKIFKTVIESFYYKFR
jgi:DNA-binding MarR family transcriptional regulator